MDALQDNNEDGIEALISRANELTSQFENELSCLMDDMDIGDDHSLYGDYDSITTCDEDGLPRDEDGLALTPGNEFDLTERTSNIISTYRDYIKEIEIIKERNQRMTDEAVVARYRDYLRMKTVTTKNQILTDEMDSLMDFWGVSKSYPPARADVESSIEIHEEGPRSCKYSQPLLRSHQVKKRLFKAVVAVALMGSLAIFSFFSTATSDKETNLNQWDPELAQELQQDSESANKALMEKAQVRPSVSMKEPQWEQLPTDQSKRTNSAMMIVQDIIAHPKAVPLLSPPRETDVDDVGKATNDSPKAGKVLSGSDVLAKSGKSTKSAKMLVSKSAKNTKMKFENSSNAKTSIIKSGKKTLSKMNTTGYMSATTDTTLRDTNEARAVRLHLESADILYQAISNQYNPMFYDQSLGWEGNSFKDALSFCKDHYPIDSHGGGVPCPYEVYWDEVYCCLEDTNNEVYCCLEDTNNDPK